MSNSFANQTLAQLDLWKNKDSYKVAANENLLLYMGDTISFE